MVFDWPTAPMYQPMPDRRAVNFKELHVRRRAGGLGGSDRVAQAALSFVTTAASKVAVNWIQLCYN